MPNSRSKESATAGAAIRADALRITGRDRLRDVVVLFIVGDTFRYNVALRLAQHARNPASQFLLRYWLRRLRNHLGINIPAPTSIGPGLLIGHAGGIVINAQAKIGTDCNLSHGVTIGVSRGRNAGVPTIGDRVYIGPGAVLIGAIAVGDDAAIGANAVVTKDVPAGMTAIGNPVTIRPGGSGDYVHRTSGRPAGP